MTADELLPSPPSIFFFDSNSAAPDKHKVILFCGNSKSCINWFYWGLLQTSLWAFRILYVFLRFLDSRFLQGLLHGTVSERDRLVSLTRWWTLLFKQLDILPFTDTINFTVTFSRASISCDGDGLAVTREQGIGGAPVWQSTLKGLFPHCSKIYLKWYFDTNISPNVYVVQEHLQIL